VLLWLCRRAHDDCNSEGVELGSVVDLQVQYKIEASASSALLPRCRGRDACSMERNSVTPRRQVMGQHKYSRGLSFVDLQPLHGESL
jgi:hypothetical protein